MQCDTLPHIEHLHLTMENGLYTSDQSHNGYENRSCRTLSPNDFHQSQTNLVH